MNSIKRQNDPLKELINKRNKTNLLYSSGDLGGMSLAKVEGKDAYSGNDFVSHLSNKSDWFKGRKDEIVKTE